LNANVPKWLWIGGLIVFGALSVVLLSIFYNVEWYKMIVFQLLIPICAVGIIQGTGLTDWNLASSFGKLVMFIAGAWSNTPEVVPVLILCQITIAGCSQATDLMQDFKTGYLTGASPRSMYLAQFVGCGASTFIAPTVWTLINSAYEIPGEKLKAIYGPFYRSIAVLSLEGFSALPKHVVLMMIIAGIATLVVNAAVSVIGKKFPKAAQFMPTPFAIALGLLVGPPLGIDLIMGCIICIIWEMRDKETFQRVRFVIAAGLLAGEGLSTLIQIFFNLAGLEPPVNVSFSSAASSSE